MATLPDNRSLAAARVTQKRLSSTARGTRSNPPAPRSPPRRAAEEPAGQPVADTVRKAGWRGDRAIQFSIFPSLPESSTPSPLAGGEGWDGGEKHGLGTPPACTPTLALPLAQGEGKDRQARVRKLNGPVFLEKG